MAWKYYGKADGEFNRQLKIPVSTPGNSNNDNSKFLYRQLKIPLMTPGNSNIDN